MNHISKESSRVLAAIRKYGPIRPSELIGVIGISSKTLFKHLSTLLDEQLIKKNGSTNRIFYSINDTQTDRSIVSDQGGYIIERNYIYVSASGEVIRGLAGFDVWCRKNAFSFEKEKKSYVSQFIRNQKLRKNGLFSAKRSILSGQGTVYLDDVFFNDFYTLGHFGKTKMGQLVYLGKTAQDKALIREIADIVRPNIIGLIEKYKIGKICYIPPTIQRKTQFMDIFSKRLGLDLPEIDISKVPDSKVAQKTLKKLEDRIENASATIAVNPGQSIDSNVLIIDDATGSGATLDQTAKKIKNIAGKKIKVFGFSVVGSYKGFDVISEV